jgi:phosphomannomutase
MNFRGRSPARLAFGTSGLRGLVTEITDLEAYVNVRGFLDYLVDGRQAARGTPVAVAGDHRPSTERILGAVTRAIEDAGFRVTYHGRIPTPALMAHAVAGRIPSVMVTGSHIPFDRNGIKLNRPDGEVLKEDEAPILAAVERARAAAYAEPASSSPFDDGGMLRAPPALPPVDDAARAGYLRRYLDFFPPGALSGLRVGLYEHSAVGRELLAEVLRGLGATVHPVGRTTGFVAIDTEAISDDKLAELERIAAGLRAEVGEIDALVSTDGDSDRPMVLAPLPDGRLRFCSGDLLGLLVASYVHADAACVPITSSDAIEPHLGAAARVVRTRIGSPHVIAAMGTIDGRRVVGWEANGGFLVGSEIEREGRRLAPLPTRDSVLPIAVALHTAALAGEPLHRVLERLPRRFTRAGLLDEVPVEQSRRARPAALPRGGDRGRGAVHRPGRARRGRAGARLLRRPRLRRDPQAQLPRRCPYLLRRRRHRPRAAVGQRPPAPHLRVAGTEERAAAIVAAALEEPDGILRRLLGPDRH